MATLTVQYKVIQHFENEAPEVFGYENLSKYPKVGEVIQLHWLNGLEAYKVRVKKVVGTVIQVEAV